MRLKLRVWRQPESSAAGKLVEYDVPDVSPDMSFLEMLDVVNEDLITRGEDPIAFDSDCREGICGTCSMVIDGLAHGPTAVTSICPASVLPRSSGRYMSSTSGGGAV